MLSSPLHVAYHAILERPADDVHNPRTAARPSWQGPPVMHGRLHRTFSSGLALIGHPKKAACCATTMTTQAALVIFRELLLLGI